MSISESLYFIYDGIKSTDMKIMNVHVSTGLYTEHFLSDREIIEEEIRGRDRPYFLGIKRSPIVLKLTFAFEETWNEELIGEVGRWLNQDYYKELYFSDDLNRRYYTMCTDSTELIHNGLKQGYITLTMRNIDCFSYSQVFFTDIFDLSSNSTSQIIDIRNTGDVVCKPIIYIEKIGNGNVSIFNLSNGGKEFKLEDLLDKEILSVHCIKEEITTNIPLIYRYDDHNGYFLELVYGVNKLQVTGRCKLRFKYQCKVLQR